MESTRTDSGQVSRLVSASGAGLIAVFLFLLGCAHSNIKPPKIIERGKLEYPLRAKLAQMQGDVLLGLEVDERGRVEEATVDASSGYPILDEAALRYARSLRFRPAMIGERPVRAHTELLLKFRLRKDHFDPDRWMDQVLALQASLEKAGGEERRELLRQLLEAYVAFARFARSDGRPALSHKVRGVVLPAVQRRWRAFWGRHPAYFVVLDDFLERAGDEPGLSSIAEGELLEMLVAAARELRFRLLSDGRERRQKEKMISAIEHYLKTRFPELHESAGASW